MVIFHSFVGLPEGTYVQPGTFQVAFGSNSSIVDFCSVTSTISLRISSMCEKLQKTQKSSKVMRHGASYLFNCLENGFVYPLYAQSCLGI